MRPSKPRGKASPSTDPPAYVTAAAVIRDEAAKWRDKPWNPFGQGPSHIRQQAAGPEMWKKLAWSRISAWNIALYRKSKRPQEVLTAMNRLAELWDRQATLHPPADLSPPEQQRFEAANARTPLTPAAPITNGFAAIEPILPERAPEGLFVIGGGSVLQMRYDHRDSTDIDLFYPQNRTPEVARLGRQGLWATALQPDPQFHEAAAASGFTPDGTRASVFPTPVPTDSSNTQPITGHRIPAQLTRNILHGKFLRCAEEPRDLTIRDLYDLTVASRLEPDATAQALGVIKGCTELSGTIVENLKRASENLHETDRARIINPKYDLELHGLAKRLIPLIETGDPGYAPQTKRHDDLGQALYHAKDGYER